MSTVRTIVCFMEASELFISITTGFLLLLFPISLSRCNISSLYSIICRSMVPSEMPVFEGINSPDLAGSAR